VSQITDLASVAITAADTVTIELVETDEAPAVIIVRWPARPILLHAHRFPATADTAARIFAAATVRLAQIRRDRRLRTAKERARRGARRMDCAEFRSVTLHLTRDRRLSGCA
jgi:hypothetical protein